MNKQDLINAIAEGADLTKVKAGEALDAFLETVTKTLKKGGEISLIGFGKFLVAKRKATKGKNPRTGEEIKIPAKKQPKFQAGKALKDAVNK